MTFARLSCRTGNTRPFSRSPRATAYLRFSAQVSGIFYQSLPGGSGGFAHGPSGPTRRRRGVSCPAATVSPVDTTYRVGELAGIIASAIARALPDEVWVEGEIRDLTRSRSGHVYFTLVDASSGDAPAAVLPVTLFASDRAAVNRVLVRSGAMRMTDGVRVRIRGRVGHYAPRGAVQLRMTWIDTDYTVGKLDAERRALLDRLRRTGLLERNAALPIPLVPLRLGLVTSVGSAAHADFLHELEVSGFGFAVVVADARVQGVEATTSVAAAMAALGGAGVDLVALVRGGGAQTDLAVFDAEELARAVVECPVPVFTGIGHEVDTTVADHVAARALKTPTACAQEVVRLVREVADRLRLAAEELGRIAPAAVGGAQRDLDRVQQRVASAARLQVGRHGEAVGRTEDALRRNAVRALLVGERRLDATAARVGVVPRTRLRTEQRRIDEALRSVRRTPGRALDRQGVRLDGLDALRRAQAPETMLARGWSVTYGETGRLVRSPEDTHAGERLRTVTAGGDIASVVDGESTGETAT
jgi:exodeoxyribonuclease VII large subunit